MQLSGVMSGLAMGTRCDVASRNAISRALMQCIALPVKMISLERCTAHPAGAHHMFIKFPFSTCCSQIAGTKRRFCTRYQWHPQLPSHNAIQIQASPAHRAKIQCFKACQLSVHEGLPILSHPTLKSGKRCWRPGCDR